MKIATPKHHSNTNKINILSLSDIPKVEKTYVVMNDKDKISLVKSVETIVRRSLEYQQYIKFLKDEIDMRRCSYFKNVVNDGVNHVSIEIHHEPFTLFDITAIVVERMLSEDVDINPLKIAEEVMRLHYMNKVGLIPLSETVHELVHDGKLFIPLQNVYGDYISFLDEYGDYISDNIKNVLEVKLKLSKDIHAHDTSILDTKYTYLEIDGMEFPEVITD